MRRLPLFLGSISLWMLACGAGPGPAGPEGPEGPAGPPGPPGQDYTPDLLGPADLSITDATPPFSCAPGALFVEGSDNWICSHNGADAVRELDSPTVANRLKLLTAEGDTLRIDDLGKTFLTYTPGEAGASTWAAHVVGFPNAASTRQNQVFRWGWNLAGGGGAIVPGEAAIGDEWESFYAPGSSYVERHIAYVNPAGRVYRPLSWRIDRQTDEIIQLVTGSTIDWMDRDNNVLFKMDQSGPATGFISLLTQQPLIHFLNNVPLIAQRNATNTGSVEVARVDNNNQVILANGGNPTVAAGTLTTRGETISPSGVRIGDTVNNRPTCAAATRGRMWISQGGTGVTDELDVCMKTAGDTYVWRTILQGD